MDRAGRPRDPWGQARPDGVSPWARWGVGLEDEPEREPLALLRLELGSGSRGERRRAIQQLGQLSIPDASVAPVLVGALTDRGPEIRLAVAELLARIGPPAAGPLGRRLDGLPEDAIGPALRVLTRSGTLDPAASAFAVRSLDRPRWVVRMRACQALARSSDRGVDPVPALLARLGDEDSSVRAVAAEALGRLGGEDRLGTRRADALDRVARLLGADTDWERESAIWALGRAGLAPSHGGGRRGPSRAAVRILRRGPGVSDR